MPRPSGKIGSLRISLKHAPIILYERRARHGRLTGVFMVQRQGQGGLGMSDQFETLVYQAIVD